MFFVLLRLFFTQERMYFECEQDRQPYGTVAWVIPDSFAIRVETAKTKGFIILPLKTLLAITPDDTERQRWRLERIIEAQNPTYVEESEDDDMPGDFFVWAPE